MNDSWKKAAVVFGTVAATAAITIAFGMAAAAVTTAAGGSALAIKLASIATVGLMQTVAHTRQHLNGREDGAYSRASGLSVSPWVIRGFGGAFSVLTGTLIGDVFSTSADILPNKWRSHGASITLCALFGGMAAYADYLRGFRLRALRNPQVRP